MKKIAVVVALVLAGLIPTNAQAANTQFTGGPLNNLDSASAIIHVALSNFPTKGGLYLQECVEATAGTRPTLCNNAVQLWISNAAGASFTPTADIIFKPTGIFTSGSTAVDCTTSRCGIFIRYDHTVPTDVSEDQFIALTFKTASAGTPSLPVDEITATLNGVAMSTKTPITLAYRSPAVLVATSKGGATLSPVSLAPACSLKGSTVTALKGTGYCDIAITSAGNSKVSAVTAHFPIALVAGVQTIPSVAAKKSVVLPRTTNFGEKVSYAAKGGCAITRNVLKTTSSNCVVTAKAAGREGLYSPLNQKLVVKSK